MGKGPQPDVHRACNARLLVLDDVGWNPHDASVVAHVLHERMERRRATIVTSGMTSEALRERYGAAVLRKLTDAAHRVSLVVDCHQPVPEDIKARAAGDS